MTATPGRGDAAVAVGVATLWTDPHAPRACDAPAVADVPDVSAWVAGLTDAERRDLRGRTLSQLLLGDAVDVEEVAGGWARVVALGQVRSGQDPRGYPGWVRAAHLVASAEPPTGERFVVDALVSTLLDGAGRGRAALHVVFGTSLTAAGPAEHGYLPVAVAGRRAPLWARCADMARPGAKPEPQQLIDAARRFAGVPYVWGGTSPYGIDCSGLVYLVHRRCGAVVPRDADDQEAAAARVDGDDQSPGRLVFFRDGSGGIDHVGIVDGPGQLLHASGSAGRVQREPFPADLAARVASVRRFVA